VESQLAEKVKEAFERNPGSTIVIKADSRLSYGDVKKAMLTIKNAGYPQVGLITEKKDKA
jgi:biopolymer transport protein ExbD